MPDIRHLVFIRSTPEKIYEALTTQQGIASWWSRDNNAKPEPGNIYRIHFGGTYYKEIKVTALIPGKKVSWEILDAHPEWLGTKLSFDITMTNKTGELRFNHSGWSAYTDMYSQCNHHWGYYLQNLRIFCEKGEPMALPEYFV